MRPTPERLCGLYVLVNRPRLVSDLQQFLQELGFVAARRSNDALINVSIPGSSDTPQARRVVNVYLTIWQAIHPGVRAFITERDDAWSPPPRSGTSLTPGQRR